MSPRTPLLALMLACGRSPTPGPTPPPAPEPAAVAEPAVEPDPAPATLYEGRLAGICDGSAVVRLDQADGILVAYDEASALFSYDGLGQAKGRGELQGLLGTTPDKELDLEAGVRVGDRIWWLGSHGTNGSGEPAPDRSVFFATHVPSLDLSDLTVAAKPVDLGPILAAHVELAAHLDPAKDRRAKGGGLNLEAMAEHPDGGLVVGFRSPLTGPEGTNGDALLAHLTHGEAGWSVTEVLQVALGDRGFRDLVHDGNGWLALAGPVDEGDFALFRVGLDGSAKQVGEPRFLAGLRPEALLREGAGWTVFSDDGKVKRPDPSAKDGDRGCDRIRKEHGAEHKEVYLRLRRIPDPS